MESIWSIVVIALLGAWFIASMAHQLRATWWNRYARWDVLGLLPRWSFFAPNPGRDDLHLVVRAWRADQPGGWQEPLSLGGDRRWRWLWNPRRYPRKALSDLANAMRSASVPGDQPRPVLLSRSYIALLSWTLAQVPGTRASHAQFAIVKTRGFGSARELDVLFVSDVHRVTG